MAIHSKVNKPKNYQIVSPFEVQHFVLDIPIMKEKYQYNAVKFSLKSLYPGNEDSTIIDYAKVKKSIIGIASDVANISRLKEEGFQIVSPILIAANLQKDGIVISVSENWILIQTMQNGAINHIHLYASQDLELCLNDLNNLFEHNSIESRNLILYSSCSIPFECFIKQFNFKILKRESEIPVSVLKISSIYVERKNNNRFIPLIAISALLIIILSLIDISLYKRSLEKQNEVVEIKKKYEAEKNKINTTTDINEQQIALPQKYSIATIMSVISDVDTSMRILSFYVNNLEIRFEAECSNAVFVLEGLSNSELFENTTLHQSIPTESGLEKAVFSMRVLK